MTTKIALSMIAVDVASQAELDAEASTARSAESAAQTSANNAATAAAAKLAGDTVQTVRTATGAVNTTATAIPLDDTIPTSTEGAEFMTQAITPASATNILEIQVVVFGTSSSAGALTAALFQDAGAAAIAVGTQYVGTANGIVALAFNHRMVAGTTAATTFRVRCGPSAGTMTFNGAVAGRFFGGAFVSSITIREIKV